MVSHTDDELDPIPAEFLAQLEAVRHADRLADEVEARAWDARYDAETGRVEVELKNGAMYAFPAKWVKSLAAAAPEELAAVELDSAGDGLRWDALDEDVSVSGMLGRVAGPSFAYKQMASLGGRSRSEAKAAAARANGRKGGRPRKTPLPPGGEVSYPAIMAAMLAAEPRQGMRAHETPAEYPAPRAEPRGEHEAGDASTPPSAPSRKKKKRGE